jgi:hypothetical protein
MSCRDDLQVVRECRMRFRRTLKAEDQPATDVLIARVIKAADRRSRRATAG